MDDIKFCFDKLSSTTKGAFQAQPILLTPVGDELVAMYRRNQKTIEEETIVIDVVLVWRVVGSRIAKARACCLDGLY
ncbi:MAG: hypothetical protein ACRBCJ_13335 [Hyphomicrobiaceae bacterium]